MAGRLTPMRLWYARRGISWLPLLACLVLALFAVLLVRQWPTWGIALLPASLALSAAATGFVFDESATAVVAVTPRGAGWRRTARCVVALLPASVWVGTVTALDVVTPGLDRGGWVLAGLGCQLVALGAAALASRQGVDAPGSAVASVLILLVLMPMVVGPMAGWEPVFPLGAFETWVALFWVAVAAVGAAFLARALRPGLR